MHWIGIKAGQKWVSLTRFENELGIKSFLQQPTQARFSDTYQSFNNDIFRQDIPLTTDLRRSAIYVNSGFVVFWLSWFSKDTF